MQTRTSNLGSSLKRLMNTRSRTHPHHSTEYRSVQSRSFQGQESCLESCHHPQRQILPCGPFCELLPALCATSNRKRNPSYVSPTLRRDKQEQEQEQKRKRFSGVSSVSGYHSNILDKDKDRRRRRWPPVHAPNQSTHCTKVKKPIIALTRRKAPVVAKCVPIVYEFREPQSTSIHPSINPCNRHNRKPLCHPENRGSKKYCVPVPLHFTFPLQVMA